MIKNLPYTKIYLGKENAFHNSGFNDLYELVNLKHQFLFKLYMRKQGDDQSEK